MQEIECMDPFLRAYRERDTLCFEGDLDHRTAPTFGIVVRNVLLEEQVKALTLDLQHLLFADSSGVIELLNVNNLATDKHKKIELRLGKVIQHVLIISGKAEELGVIDE